MSRVVRSLLQYWQTILSVGAPVGVAAWLGFTMPSRLAAIDQRQHRLKERVDSLFERVDSLSRGQLVSATLQCLDARGKPELVLAVIQLGCDRFTAAIGITQAGAPAGSGRPARRPPLR